LPLELPLKFSTLAELPVRDTGASRG